MSDLELRCMCLELAYKMTGSASEEHIIRVAQALYKWALGLAELPKST